MTPSSLRTEIQNFIELLAQKGIAIVANQVQKTHRPEGVTRITWTASQPGQGELFRDTSATIGGYMAWLKAGAYSAVLYDGALLQITYDMQGRSVVGHRLAYLPCPFDVDEALLREEPLHDVIESYHLSREFEVKLRSPLRFDYDPESQADGHPSTHLTMLFSHCRWAVSAPLSLGHFVRFVFRHFYPELWQAHEFVRECPQHSLVKSRTITHEEAAMLHVTWLDALSGQGNRAGSRTPTRRA